MAVKNRAGSELSPSRTPRAPNITCAQYTVVAASVFRAHGKRQTLGELIYGSDAGVAELCEGGSTNGGFRSWSTEQCAPAPLVPQRTSIVDSLLGRVNVLLAVSRDPQATLLTQVKKVLLQASAARRLGMVPAAFLGDVGFAPSACARRTSTYHDKAAGANVWDYYFAPLSPGYSLVPTLLTSRRPFRVFVTFGDMGLGRHASMQTSMRRNRSEITVSTPGDDGRFDVDDGAEEAEEEEAEEEAAEEEAAEEEAAEEEAADDGGSSDEDQPSSSDSTKAGASRSDGNRAPHSRQRIRMARLVRRFLRVRPPCRRAAAALLRPWRSRGGRSHGDGVATAMAPLLGVALHADWSSSAGLDVQKARSVVGSMHTLIDAFLHNGGPEACVVVVGAAKDQLHLMRRRYGERHICHQDETPSNAGPLCADAHGSGGACAGHREVVDALLLAHCDFLLVVPARTSRSGRRSSRGSRSSSLPPAIHPAAEFAMWYNPLLMRANHEVQAAAQPPALSELPRWAGGRWEPPAEARTLPRRMLAALLSDHGEESRGGGRTRASTSGGGESASLDARFVPGLPPPRRAAGPHKSPWVEISGGQCAAAAGGGARRMGLGECAAYAAKERKHFLGQSVDRSEYPGCTLWLDTHLVEFNDHTDERMGCNFGARGKCICARTAGGSDVGGNSRLRAKRRAITMVRERERRSLV